MKVQIIKQLKVLGIDPATKTGWALLVDGKRVSSGVVNLKGKANQLGQKFSNARDFFANKLKVHADDLDVVAYEEVRRFMSSAAALSYCGITSQLLVACEDEGIPYVGLSPTEVKKAATGSGRASKEEMIAQGIVTFSHIAIDDNEADALFIALAAHKLLSQKNEVE